MTGKPADWGPGEMTTAHAVAYLNERLDSPITPDILTAMRRLTGHPIAEKRGRRLVFTAPKLDVFLAEYDTDPLRWIHGISHRQISDLRARGIHDEQIESLLRGLDPGAHDWNPDDAR